jgi:hypothetical protein
MLEDDDGAILTGLLPKRAIRGREGRKSKEEEKEREENAAGLVRSADAAEEDELLLAANPCTASASDPRGKTVSREMMDSGFRGKQNRALRRRAARRRSWQPPSSVVVSTTGRMIIIIVTVTAVQCSLLARSGFSIVNGVCVNP